ncbi:hypothetical protein HOY82DRAFT_199810 [Tuber indicum]|nr:hypothetical protein HOY82DRAFT_188394 [Tuber indicum]KAG0134901.1 hypothetical protein HOY82DRAFT_199810 [Tuber indicum]
MPRFERWWMREPAGQFGRVWYACKQDEMEMVTVGSWSSTLYPRVPRNLWKPANLSHYQRESVPYVSRTRSA